MKRKRERIQSKLLSFTLHMAGCLLALTIAQQAFAAGTPANTAINNFATVNYSVGGVAQTAQISNTASFVVDHRVRPIVASLGNQDVVAGSANQYLAFQVTNDGNTETGVPLTIVLSNEQNGALNMGAISYYVESDGTPGLLIGSDTGPVLNIALEADEQATVYLVGSTPGGASAGDIGTYDLIATADLGNEAAADDQSSVQFVYADDAGTATGDVQYDRRHSAEGIFTVVAFNLAAVKTSSVVNDGIHAAAPYFAIPGATVRYQIVVSNPGSLPASGVTITDTIDTTNLAYVPDSVTIDTVSYLDSAAEVDFSTPVLTVTVPGDIAASGGSTTITFDVLINN